MSKPSYPIVYFLPNLVTVIALCCGLTSIKYSMDGRWEIAVALLVIAAFLDGIDGRLAKILNASSKFGAELDSLADFANFGIAPAILAYQWSLHNFPIKGVGWAVALMFVISMGFRLARFNVIDKDDKIEAKNFFAGIPAPSSAGLSLVPIMLSFKLEIFFFQEQVIAHIIYLFILIILTISNISTFSVKNIKVTNAMIVPLILVTIFMVVAFITEPWISLPIFGVIYLLSIPITMIFFKKKTEES